MNDGEATDITNGTFDLITTGFVSCDNFTKSSHYTGFPDRTSTSLSWNDANATLTLTATSDPVWINGVSYTINTLTKAFTSGLGEASGLYWFWITAPGGIPQLNYATSISDLFSQCLVATVYWNTTTNKGLLGDERHWMGRDKYTHEYLHETVGARYYTGLTGTFANTTFSITAGEFYDEDLEHFLSSDNPMTYPGTAITTCKVLYHNGDADWAWDAASTTPYKITTGNLRFNTGNTLSTAGANKYVNYWIFASAGVAEPIWAVIGTAEYNTIANARAATVPSLGSLPSPEVKLIYKIIYKNDGTPKFQEAIDYRSTQVLGTTFVPTDHATLSNLSFATSGHNGVLTTDNFISDVATGTSPYAATSTTLNTNLNADLLDSLHESAFVLADGTRAVTGAQTFNIGIVPDANDGAYLGTSALGFSDLFLAEGGVINWDNGDVTLTQTNNVLTLAGGDLDIGANRLYTSADIKDETKCWDICIINPKGAYGVDTQIPIAIAKAALTITKVQVSLNTTAQEVAGDLKWATDLTAFTDAAVINDFDTTSGVRTDTSITSASVAAGKFIYLQFDSEPNVAITFMLVHIEWDFD